MFILLNPHFLHVLVISTSCISLNKWQNSIMSVCHLNNCDTLFMWPFSFLKMQANLCITLSYKLHCCCRFRSADQIGYLKVKLLIRNLGESVVRLYPRAKTRWLQIPNGAHDKSWRNCDVNLTFDLALILHSDYWFTHTAYYNTDNEIMADRLGRWWLDRAGELADWLTHPKHSDNRSRWSNMWTISLLMT